MQPKFTQKNLGYLCLKVTALALIFLATTQVSFAQRAGRTRTSSSVQQVGSKANQQTYEQRVQQKWRNYEQRQASSRVNNDAGIPARQAGVGISSPEAICQTFTGDFAGAPTMTNRLFRPGATNSCTVPYAFPGTFAQTVPFRTFTYTNTTGLTQCGTFTLSTVGGGSNAQFAIYNGSFNPAALATNYLADPGVSGVGAPTSCQGTINAGQTIVFAVFDLGTPATSFTLTVDFPICFSAPCSGTPNPGNTNSTVTTVCPGINFTLSLQNSTIGSGVSYQWQTAATAAGPWTNAGPNSPVWTTSQAAATCYRCIVSCSSGGGTSGTSTPVCVAINPPLSCYCIPGASDCTDNDVITRVRISTLDNPSGCSTGPPPGYTNYTTTVPAPIVYSGAPNLIRVDKPTIWSEGVSVWIDYNQNGNFEAAERTDLGVVPAATATLSGNINIPTTALTGTTRMRVRMNFNALPPDPCSGMTFGETEDYNVNIQPCVPVTVTGSPANATITCGGGTSFTVTTAGSLPVYAWEYRVNASSPWLNVPNAAPYSNINTATLTLTNVPASFNGYQYRGIVSGGCSALDFSGVATLTVNPIIPVVNPNPVTICTGTLQQLTLTNLISTPTTTTFNSGTINVPIPDASLTGANHTIPVSGISGIITDITVGFSVPAHTWPGDLCAVVRSPGGQILNLDYFINNTGAGPGAGMVNTRFNKFATARLNSATAPYNGIFAPDAQTTAGANGPIGPTGFQTPAVNNFDALYNPSNGTTANGNWTIALYDGFSFDTGNLTNWFITITYVAPVFAQGTWTGPAGTMWATAAGSGGAAYTGTPATTIWVNPTANANYQVSFTTPTPCTSAVTTVPVNVTNPITNPANPTNKSVCVGGNTSFSVSAGGGPLTYQWQVSVDGGVTYSNIAGATAATLNLNAVTQVMNNNQYRCIITAAPCGAVTTGFGRLTVNPLPVVTISASSLQLTPGGVSTFTATSTPPALNATSYSWTLNGSTIAGATGSTVTGNIDGLGDYQATVTDINGCVNKSNILTLGAKESDRLWIYPNPNAGQFQVRLFYNGNQAERRIVRIYTTGGQLVAQKEFDMVTLTPPYMRMDFDLGRMSAGTYVVKVVDSHLKEITSGLVVIQ